MAPIVVLASRAVHANMVGLEFVTHWRQVERVSPFVIVANAAIWPLYVLFKLFSAVRAMCHVHFYLQSTAL